MEFGDDFLTWPELFPARRAGETRGDGQVVVDFAGGPYRFTGLSDEQVERLCGRFGDYVADTAQPSADAVDIRVFRVPAEEFRDPGTGWRDYRLDLGYGPDEVRAAGFHFMGLVRCSESTASALWTPGCDERFVESCDNFLRLVTAYRALASGRVLLHSAALARDAAVVFPGCSGAGKSTVSRLGRRAGWQVVSDELNVLAIHRAAITLQQVPFNGDLAPGECATFQPEPLSVRALCRLRKSSADRLAPLSAGHALGTLLAAAPYVNRDPYRSERLTDLLEEAVLCQPAFTLSFHRTSRLEVLEELFDGHGAGVSTAAPHTAARADAA